MWREWFFLSICPACIGGGCGHHLCLAEREKKQIPWGICYHQQCGRVCFEKLTIEEKESPMRGVCVIQSHGLGNRRHHCLRGKKRYRPGGVSIVIFHHYSSGMVI